jgi:acetylornithine deacetylase/succinyl-diaminopimelate desuccinylase-like protein
VRDGEIWGRGALDMKGQVAASAVVVASLAREGFEPGGDLIFVAAADEEVGAGYGLPWLCEHHPDAVRCEYAINEGQGDRLEIDGDVYYLCASAEKMSAPFRVVVRGRSGHASKPGIADNALVKAARIVQQLADYRAEQELIPEVRGLLAAVTGRAPETAADAVAAAAATKPPLTEIVDPLLAMTLTPTMIEASKKRNVIPATCEIVVDSRLLPGRTPADARTVVERVLGAGDYELEWIEAQGGTRSPTDTPLWHAVAEFVEAEEPGARIAPVCVAGFTDSHWLRDAFGTVAYGFFPLRTMSPAVADLLVHSADERASVDDLELGVRFLRHVAERIGAGTL